jgi:hypothetical protein
MILNRSRGAPAPAERAFTSNAARPVSAGEASEMMACLPRACRSSVTSSTRFAVSAGLPPSSSIERKDAQLIFTRLVRFALVGYSQSRSMPSRSWVSMKDLAEATKAARETLLDAISLKYALGKFHPPTEMTMRRSGFKAFIDVVMYLKFCTSVGSVVTTVNGGVWVWSAQNIGTQYVGTAVGPGQKKAKA